MALQSELLGGDPALEAAAVSNPAHILPGSRGDHVVKIQQALIQVSGAVIDADGVYGPATAAAVADFKRKHQPPILNFAGQIDDIVGIKTLAALDALLPKPGGGGGPSLNFNIVVTTLDVVVSFFGAAGTGPGLLEDSIPLGFLPKYKKIPSDPTGALLRNTDNNNLLLRITQKTTDFGARGFANMFAVINAIDLQLGKPDPDNNNAVVVLGKVFVIGTSSGGRVVFDFVNAFVPKFQVTPHLVASIDASFSLADTTDRPTKNSDPASPIPTFTLPFGQAAIVRTIPLDRRLNFFQNQGNHTKRILDPTSSRFLQILYTSNMSGGTEEIHGKINEMNNIQIQAVGTTDDEFHEFCDPAGRREAQLRIRLELQPSLQPIP